MVAVDLDVARGGHIHAADEVEQGGFSRARGSGDGGELPLLYGQLNPAHGVHDGFAEWVVLDDVAQGDDDVVEAEIVDEDE